MVTMHESRTSVEVTGASNTIRLRTVLRAAWNGKWYLIGCLALSLALGAGYLMTAEPIYKVGARLLVQQEGFPLEQEIRNRDDKDFLATQAEIIRSPAVVVRAAAELEQVLDGVPKSSATSILGSLRVHPLTGTNVLSIGFRSRDEALAVRTVNAVIDSYRRYLQEMDRDSNLQALNLLTQNEKMLRDDLESLETKHRELRRGSLLMGQGIQAAAIQRSLLENLGKSLSETRTRRIELENQIRVMTWSRSQAAHAGLASRGSVMAVVSAPGRLGPVTRPADTIDLIAAGGALLPNKSTEGYENLKTFQEQLALAEIRQRTLERQFGEKHPEMKAVHEEIKAWRRILRETVENAPKVLERDLATIELQEQRLADLYKKEFEQAKVVDGHLLEEQQALDGIERVQLIHASLLTQLQELQLADQALNNGRLGVRVSILEAPALTNRPIWPQKTLLFGGCVAIGLLAGIGLIAGFARPPTSRTRTSESLPESTGSALVV